MRRGLDRARGEWEDVERRIRQRMRIYPQKHKNVAAAQKELEDPEPESLGLAQARNNGPSKPEAAHPIISIHGRDLAEEKFDDPAA